MTQFKFLTSWYQVPIKDCLEGMKPYLFDYANKEFFVYSAMNKTSYSIITIGFYREDTEFSNPVVLSYTGLEDEEFSVFCNELKEQSEYYNPAVTTEKDAALDLLIHSCKLIEEKVDELYKTKSLLEKSYLDFINKNKEND